MEEFLDFQREYVTDMKCSVKRYVHVREIWKKMWWMRESLGSVIIMSEV